MSRQSSGGPVRLVLAAALVLPFLSVPAARAGTIGGGGGEMMGYKYELYLKREAERKKQQARPGAPDTARQKAGIGSAETGDSDLSGPSRPRGAPGLFEDPQTRGR